MIMEKVLDVQFAELINGASADREEYFRQYCRFFQQMTYDTISFEVTIRDCLPDHGAIYGGRPGPIQNQNDFDRYPWEELADRYWQTAEPQFDSLVRNLPPGMMALGEIGNGVFEIMDDVIALEINAKYSNEDAIAPFDDCIARYGERIGLLGGIDVDILCRNSPDEIVDEVFEKSSRFRAASKGYALLTPR